MKYILLCLTLLMAACGTEKMDVMLACVSPSGQKTATLYRISSGDNPRDAEMKVNVRLTSSTFDKSMYSFAFRDGYDAIIRWHSDSDISITYPLDSELTRQEMVIFGTSQSFNPTDQIKVNYQEKPSTHGYLMVEQRCFH